MWDENGEASNRRLVQEGDLRCQGQHRLHVDADRTEAARRTKMRAVRKTVFSMLDECVGEPRMLVKAAHTMMGKIMCDPTCERSLVGH